MFKLESDVDKATRRLVWLGSTALPSVVANTLDNLAFTTKGESEKQFEKDHVVRSNWTQRGTLFEKTKRNTTIAQMESRTGNIRDYAPILESGGIVTPRKKRLMSPALAARGGNIKKKIRPTSRLDRLKPRKLPPGKSLKRRFAMMLNIARRDNYYGPFITNPGVSSVRIPKGIFMLRRSGRKKRGGGKIVMIRKIQRTAKVRGHSFIEKPAVEVGATMPQVYIRQAERLISKSR